MVLIIDSYFDHLKVSPCVVHGYNIVVEYVSIRPIFIRQTDISHMHGELVNNNRTVENISIVTMAFVVR